MIGLTATPSQKRQHIGIEHYFLTRMNNYYCDSASAIARGLKLGTFFKCFFFKAGGEPPAPPFYLFFLSGGLCPPAPPAKIIFLKKTEAKNWIINLYYWSYTICRHFYN